MRTALVLFTRDLRLSDHLPLAHAAAHFDAVVPLFVWAPDEEAPWAPGAAHRWWLHHSLTALGASLDAEGSRLTLRAGPTLDALRSVVAETGATAVFWHAAVEPVLRARDAALLAALRADGIDAETFPGRILHDPEAVRTGAGTPYRVFGPFHRALTASLDVPPPLPAPRLASKAPAAWPRTDALDAFDLLPTIPWDAAFPDSWTPGEAAARERLAERAGGGLSGYATRRDRPADDGTSRLSPRLHWGELSPREIWHVAGAGTVPPADRDVYLKEVAWREFAVHLLWHYPHTTDAPLRPEFARLVWRDDPEALRRWQRGQTGFPIVDAGMRQLWETGWMHNRVRMIVASLLSKDLLLPWTDGARWFWDTLVDADLASNTFGWQWVAGSGADAQPFFRIFNPAAQGQKFDPDGAYVRRWVPELARLPDRYLHEPATAPAAVLAAAGVRLGQTYPRPVVDRTVGRRRALDAFAALKAGREA